MARVFKDGQYVEVETFIKNGAILRHGTYDESIMSEIPRVYGDLNYENAVVMDIGANIGLFARYAYDKGAKKIICYEPDISNYELLGKNVQHAVIFKAAIGKAAGEIALYANKSGKNPGSTSTTPFRGRQECDRAPVIPFQEALYTYRPELLKIDCEGAEYDFLNGKELPHFVKGVTIEIHTQKKEWRDTKAQQLINTFDDWICLRRPVIRKLGFPTQATWVRQ